MRCHLTPVRVTIKKESTNNKCWRGCGEKPIVLVQMRSGAVIVENSMEVSQKTKNRVSI